MNTNRLTTPLFSIGKSLAASLITAITTAALADPPGLQTGALFLPHHEKTAPVTIWYPSRTRNTQSLHANSLYADNAVFEGVKAQRAAPIKPGAHHLVLFNHGLGGSNQSQAWLGAALAERGAIVLFIDHPHSSRDNFNFVKATAHWTRRNDMRLALDSLLDDPFFSGSIDQSRIMAAGFSYGGWTALSLGGATGNHAGLIEACITVPQIEFCDLLLSDEVRLQDQDPERWNARYADPRVTLVAAIDPGLIWGLEPSNLTELLPSTLLIGLGSAAERMLVTDFDASGLSAMLDEQQSVRLAPAAHFTAMPLCKPEGAAILQAEQNDPVCTDPAGTNRADVHRAIVDLLSQALGISARSAISL